VSESSKKRYGRGGGDEGGDATFQKKENAGKCEYYFTWEEMKWLHQSDSQRGSAPLGMKKGGGDT